MIVMVSVWVFGTITVIPFPSLLLRGKLFKFGISAISTKPKNKITMLWLLWESLQERRYYILFRQWCLCTQVFCRTYRSCTPRYYHRRWVFISCLFMCNMSLYIFPSWFKLKLKCIIIWIQKPLWVEAGKGMAFRPHRTNTF